MPADGTHPTGLENFPAVRQELDRCMKCGFCMSVCPVYAAEKSEGAVARGKIGIAEAVISGDLALDDQEVIDTLFDCLVCKSCMQSCPSGVQFDRIMLDLRAAIVKKKGLPWLKAAIFAGLRVAPDDGWRHESGRAAARAGIPRGSAAARDFSALAVRDSGPARRLR